MRKMWILTLVKRGFIQEPEIFYDASKAQNRKNELIQDFNSDYDEIDIFEKQIYCNCLIEPSSPATKRY